MSKTKFDFRDISAGLKKLRAFLLGRPHDLENLHLRFPPRLSSRSIPKPDVPRGPDSKYSNNFYYQRSAQNSVKPPVVAPIAEGPLNPGVGHPMKPGQVMFSCVPTPGPPWAWDGHCYFDCAPDTPPPSPPMMKKGCPTTKKECSTK